MGDEIGDAIDKGTVLESLCDRPLAVEPCRAEVTLEPGPQARAHIDHFDGIQIPVGAIATKDAIGEGDAGSGVKGGAISGKERMDSLANCLHVRTAAEFESWTEHEAFADGTRHGQRGGWRLA